MPQKPPPGTERQPPRGAAERAVYSRPRLRRWGSIAEVTRKTGASLDMNQVMKMGLG